MLERFTLNFLSAVKVAGVCIMASKAGVYNLRFAQRQTFLFNLESGKYQLGKFVLSSVATWAPVPPGKSPGVKYTWSQIHYQIQQDASAGKFLYPLALLKADLS